MSPTPATTLVNFRQTIDNLQRQLAEAHAARDKFKAERDEALQQQAAAAEVLQAINASPGDPTPVFEAMLEKATRLCNAAFGVMQTYDGEAWRAVATRAVPPAYAEFLKTAPPTFGPGTAPARVLAGEPLVHVVDITDTDAYRAREPNRVALAELGRARSIVLVPLRRDQVVLGVINIYRQEVRQFSQKEIALLQNFAAQAIIAMENARLITETREALEHQTAIADVLKVISRSTFDLQPVLDTLAETAARLCDAGYGAIYRRDGDVYRIAAAIAFSPEAAAAARKFQAFVQQHPLAADRGTITGRVALERRAVHVIDTACDPEYKLGEATTLGNLHTQLGVPMLRDGEPIGVIALARQRVEPFTDRQIELARTFADQAVIAIENARLLTETREALEQQTATAEVLGVINSSPGDLAPVFDAMLEKAHRLCGISHGIFGTYDGEHFRAVATRGLDDAAASLLRRPFRPLRGSPHERLAAGAELVHLTDLTADTGWDADDPKREAALGHGTRFLLFVPLRKDGRLLGYFSAHRREARPFAEREIALLQNFAAQAVITMENARLLDEIRQRQQELRVTFDNMGDAVAMFDSELRLAAWNRNFQELLDLSDEYLARPRHLDDYIRHLAERGEFGIGADPAAEVTRLRARFHEHYRFERTRPDGRVLEVRHNPMPEGGMVLIYSDITERKRAEEEIRKARDAAEAALGELKATQASLLHSQKLAALGQLTAGIAHEIKNPLNFVNNFAGVSHELLDELKETAGPALASLDPDKRAEVDETIAMLTSNLGKIAEHGRRADGIVKSMLEHSRGSSGDRRPTDLNALVDEALNLAYHGARAQDQGFNIVLERDFDASLAPIEVVPQEVTRVFLNLIGNGFYAATKKSGNRPVLKVATRDLGTWVEIRVHDNGTGIPPDVRDKLFQPFFTTKPTGEGTGLGLSISYDIVTQQHGGTIEVDSEVGRFTEFTVRLPRPERRQRAGAAD